MSSALFFSPCLKSKKAMKSFSVRWMLAISSRLRSIVMLRASLASSRIASISCCRRFMRFVIWCFIKNPKRNTTKSAAIARMEKSICSSRSALLISTFWEMPEIQKAGEPAWSRTSSRPVVNEFRGSVLRIIFGSSRPLSFCGTGSTAKVKWRPLVILWIIFGERAIVAIR